MEAPIVFKTTAILMYLSLQTVETVSTQSWTEENLEIGWCVSTVEGSISSSRLFDSSNCIITSSSSKYSELRAKRNWLPLVDEQQMPESSEPKLDWSKFGVELAVVMVMLLPITVTQPALESILLRAWRTGLEEAEAEAEANEPNSTVSTEQATGSALPQTTPNLIKTIVNKEIQDEWNEVTTYFTCGFLWI